ncbi:MAG: VCBS repeat domain-containing M23 family metallopeptidase [Patescibacteria group bacterium]
MHINKIKVLFFSAIIIVGISAFFITTANAADIRSIIFPVLGPTHYSNDFGAPRSDGRTHAGNDIIGSKHQALVAVMDGTIRLVNYPEPYWGYAVILEGVDGYEYWYLHMNNDTPGTDDGHASGPDIYAPDIAPRLPVKQGQLIGYMGDSGNAEYTVDHLHFEIHRPDDNVINPYETLLASTKIFSPVAGPTLYNELLPYAQFKGGASVATGNLDNSSSGDELVTGAGPGGGPQLRVFSENENLLSQFFAYPEDFHGGLDVTTGDVDGDGIDEIITIPGAGMPANVRVFKPDGELINEFSAYPDFVRIGGNVSAADLNGDGKAEIVTGTLIGGGPQVRIFKSNGKLLYQFFAYAEGFRGGVDVAAVAATSENRSMIITGPGPGGGPQVRIFKPWGEVLGQFFVYDEQFRGGIRIDAGELNSGLPGPEIVTVPASRGGPDFRIYDMHGNLRSYLTAYERWWRGGYDVAVGNDSIYTVTTIGGRRSSVRTISP